MTGYQHHARELYWEKMSFRMRQAHPISNELQNQLEGLFLQTSEFKESNFNDFELQDVFNYLKQSHTYYLNVALPQIENTLEQLFVKFGADYAVIKILKLFIDQYKVELIEHIESEEKVLFLFVENLLSGSYSVEQKNRVFSYFIHTHNDNVVLHLEDLKNDFIRCNPLLEAHIVFQILFNQLAHFQQDLMIHGLIEDTVFMTKILQYIDHNFEKMAWV